MKLRTQLKRRGIRVFLYPLLCALVPITPIEAESDSSRPVMDSNDARLILSDSFDAQRPSDVDPLNPGSHRFGEATEKFSWNAVPYDARVRMRPNFVGSSRDFVLAVGGSGGGAGGHIVLEADYREIGNVEKLEAVVRMGWEPGTGEYGRVGALTITTSRQGRFFDASCLAGLVIRASGSVAPWVRSEERKRANPFGENKSNLGKWRTARILMERDERADTARIQVFVDDREVDEVEISEVGAGPFYVNLGTWVPGDNPTLFDNFKVWTSR